MEFEQPMLRDTLVEQKNKKIETITTTTTNSSTQSSSSSDNDVSEHKTSFHVPEKSVPRSNSPERRLSWLRFQIIGGNVEFDSPFGKRRITYADHCATGRSLHYIENFILNNVLPFYGNTHTSDSYVGHRTTKMANEASEYVKKCLGGGEDDALIFCGSGTTAAIKRLQEVMGIAIPSILRDRVLKILSNEERWVVFVGPFEHHSNILSWRQSLAEVVEIGLDSKGLLDMEALRLKLEEYQHTKRPLLGSFSACSNVTGIYSDTRALARLLHHYGGYACFDYAASAAYEDIDMRSGENDGYDAIFMSPHKFLGGPGSPGILLMSKALYQLRFSPPSTCGGGTVDYVNGFNEKYTLYVNNIEEREDAGTPPIIQKIRAAMAFWVKEYIGYQVINKQEQNYMEKALKRLLSISNIWVLGNTRTPRQAILSFLVYTTSHSSLASINTDRNADGKQTTKLYLWRETGDKRDKPLHGPFVAKLLNDLFGIQARGGCACAGPYGHHLLNIDEQHSLALRSAIQMGYIGVKPGWTRVCFPYYMCCEEFEFILAAIEFIATYGQRFLPLYQFNWKSGVWTFKEKAFKDILQRKENNRYFSVANVMQALNLESNESKEYGHGHCNDARVITKYATYLETAKQMACLLPKFPPVREIPDEVEIDSIPFRV